MKTKLFVAGAVCLVALAVWAASPSFSDFIANQFAETADKKVAIKVGAIITNTTDYVAGNSSVSVLYDNGNPAVRVTQSGSGSAITMGTRLGGTLLSYNPSSVGGLDAISLSRAANGGILFNDNGTSIFDQSNGTAITISQQSSGAELISTFGYFNPNGPIAQTDSGGSNNITSATFFRGALEIDGGLFTATNPVTAGVLDCSAGTQITNCSANPTFTGISGVTAGKTFQNVVYILANGADRTVTPPPNTHVYPSGTLTVTNGSFGILSSGGVGGSVTGAVFLAFP